MSDGFDRLAKAMAADGLTRRQALKPDSDCCAGLKCRSSYGSPNLVSSCG